MKPPSLCCLRPVIKKEFRQIRRDARSMLFMTFLPAFMLFMFGFALNFDVKHIPLAVFVPYHEKSLKDVAFDPAKDDFRDLAKLNKDKPTIFSCNGAECWKSYKASKVALASGFKNVYWFRGGLPEWEASGLQVGQD